MPHPTSGFANIPPQVPQYLGCVASLVDVLSTGATHVAYSIFDCEGAVNSGAMEAVAQLSGTAFDINDEDTVLRGAVLIVCEEQCDTNS